MEASPANFVNSLNIWSVSVRKRRKWTTNIVDDSHFGVEYRVDISHGENLSLD